MQVFKVYFKIIQKNLSGIMIYFMIFLALSVLFSITAPAQNDAGFVQSKSRIAVINEDDAQFSQSLEQYLGETQIIVPLSHDSESLLDALFIGDISYILRIPKGFSENFLNGSNTVTLEKTTAPDSLTALQIDFMINRYLSIAGVYTSALPDIDAGTLKEYISADLAKEATVVVPSDNKPRMQSSGLYNYFMYFSYASMAIIVLGVTTILLVFNNRELKRRNLASPMPGLSMNLQLVLGNVVFSLVAWGIVSAIGLLLYPPDSFAQAAPLLLNALAYTFVCLSAAMLIGVLIKSRNAQSAIATVLSLGLCFLSGVFVPRELLGDTVLTIASFTPAYWYVGAIAEFANGFSDSAVISLLIQLGYAVTLLVVSLAVSRHKAAESQ